MSAVFVVFFSFVQYTRLQWVTGIRYLAAILPFMFLAAAAVLVRLPKVLAAGLLFLSLVINWSLAMVRSQGSVLDNVERVFIAGFQLPWLTVIGKTAAQYAPWLQGGVSPLFILGLTAGVIVLIWWIRDPWKPLAGGKSRGSGEAVSGPRGTNLAPIPGRFYCVSLYKTTYYGHIPRRPAGSGGTVSPGAVASAQQSGGDMWQLAAHPEEGP